MYGSDGQDEHMDRMNIGWIDGWVMFARLAFIWRTCFPSHVHQNMYVPIQHKPRRGNASVYCLNHLLFECVCLHL